MLEASKDSFLARKTGHWFQTCLNGRKPMPRDGLCRLAKRQCTGMKRKQEKLSLNRLRSI